VVREWLRGKLLVEKLEMAGVVEAMREKRVIDGWGRLKKGGSQSH